MSPGSARLAHQLLAQLQRFCALSDEGRRACETGDVDALTAALDARDVLSVEIESITRALASERTALGNSLSLDAFDASLRPIRAAAMLASQRNAELVARAQLARTAIGEAIDRVRHESAAQSAYAVAAEPSEAPQLDLVR